MKVHRRQDVVHDSVSIEQEGMRIHIFTHRQKIIFSRGPVGSIGDTVEFSFDELNKVILNLVLSKGVKSNVSKNLRKRPEGKSGCDKVESARRNAKRGESPENESEDK